MHITCLSIEKEKIYKSVVLAYEIKTIAYAIINLMQRTLLNSFSTIQTLFYDYSVRIYFLACSDTISEQFDGVSTIYTTRSASKKDREN